MGAESSTPAKPQQRATAKDASKAADKAVAAKSADKGKPVDTAKEADKATTSHKAKQADKVASEAAEEKPLLLAGPPPSARAADKAAASNSAPLMLEAPLQPAAAPAAAAPPLALMGPGQTSKPAAAKPSKAATPAATPAAAPAAAPPRTAAAPGAAPPPFVPTYEWNTLAEGANIPAGLDVDLPLDGGMRRARIPRRWQLRLWVNDDVGFWRHDVTRKTTVKELRTALASKTKQPLEAVSFVLGSQSLNDDAATVEAIDLFNRKSEFKIVLGAGEMDLLGIS